MNIIISASNTIYRSVDSRSWQLETISRLYDNAIKSTRLPTGVPTIQQLKILQTMKKLIDEMKSLFQCNSQKQYKTLIN